MLARASALPISFFGPAQLGLLPLSVDRVDGAARAMMLSATEENIKTAARSFFIILVQWKSARVGGDKLLVNTYSALKKA